MHVHISVCLVENCWLGNFAISLSLIPYYSLNHCMKSAIVKSIQRQFRVQLHLSNMSWQVFFYAWQVEHFISAMFTILYTVEQDCSGDFEICCHLHLFIVRSHLKHSWSFVFDHMYIIKDSSGVETKWLVWDSPSMWFWYLHCIRSSLFVRTAN